MSNSVEGYTENDSTDQSDIDAGLSAPIPVADTSLTDNDTQTSPPISVAPIEIVQEPIIWEDQLKDIASIAEITPEMLASLEQTFREDQIAAKQVCIPIAQSIVANRFLLMRGDISPISDQHKKAYENLSKIALLALNVTDASSEDPQIQLVRDAGVGYIDIVLQNLNSTTYDTLESVETTLEEQFNQKELRVYSLVEKLVDNNKFFIDDDSNRVPGRKLIRWARDKALASFGTTELPESSLHKVAFDYANAVINLPGGVPKDSLNAVLTALDNGVKNGIPEVVSILENTHVGSLVNEILPAIADNSRSIIEWQIKHLTSAILSEDPIFEGVRSKGLGLMSQALKSPDSHSSLTMGRMRMNMETLLKQDNPEAINILSDVIATSVPLYGFSSENQNRITHSNWLAQTVLLELINNKAPFREQLRENAFKFVRNALLTPQIYPVDIGIGVRGAMDYLFSQKDLDALSLYEYCLVSEDEFDKEFADAITPRALQHRWMIKTLLSFLTVDPLLAYPAEVTSNIRQRAIEKIKKVNTVGASGYSKSTIAMINETQRQLGVEVPVSDEIQL